MTIYEKTELLASRTRVISEGSPITIKNPASMKPYDIACQELYAKTIPYKIIRSFPNGDEELWMVKELKIL
jgi:DNA-directed RNA polymerase subunit K/omega